MEDIEDNQDSVQYALPYVFIPDAGNFFSYYEGNESVAEVGDKSNNYLSHTVHVGIPEYKFLKMNVNYLKDKIRKRKTSVWYKNILDERLLIYLKEKAPLYVDGEGLTKKQQNRKVGYIHELFS